MRARFRAPGRPALFIFPLLATPPAAAAPRCYFLFCTPAHLTREFVGRWNISFVRRCDRPFSIISPSGRTRLAGILRSRRSSRELRKEYRRFDRENFRRYYLIRFLSRCVLPDATENYKVFLDGIPSILVGILSFLKTIIISQARIWNVRIVRCSNYLPWEITFSSWNPTRSNISPTFHDSFVKMYNLEELCTPFFLIQR